MTNKITKVYKNGVEYDIYASGGAAGTGDVTGPSSSTDADIALFDGTTGKIIKDSGKKLSDYQTALSTQTAYTTKGTATKVPTITTNTLGQVTGITETNISFPVTSVNGSTGAVTVQATLESGTNIKTVNGNSLLGSGDLSVGGSYTAGNGIDITNDEIGLNGTYSGQDYSAMQGPAPSGFHISIKSEWSGLKTIMDGLGLTTGDDWKQNLHLPFCGGRSGTDATIQDQGSIGKYRCCDSYVYYYGYYLYLTSTVVGPGSTQYPTFAFNIRCFKDVFEKPDSSWTVINGTLGGAGIFRDTTNGIISITGDGDTGYTIMDKNLGATTVYNSGDTLTQANMGSMYQRGNNYGFASTGSVTTSSAQVNAGTYGPGNYYSSSTFIATSLGVWDTSQNRNLRGGVTGILTASGKLVVGDKLYKIVEAVAAPSGAGSNIITLVV